MLLPWLITPPALCTPAALLKQSREPDLNLVPLTDSQKSLFEALSKAGYKRLRVKASANENERYIRLQVPGEKPGSSLYLYVSSKQTTFVRDIDFADSAPGVGDSFLKRVKAQFPNVGSDSDSSSNLVLLTLAVPTSELTTASGLEAIETLGKALALQKEAIAAPEAVDPIGATLGKAKIPINQFGPVYLLRMSFPDTKRSQDVAIRKEVWAYKSLKIQELSSPFYESAEPLSAELLQKAAQKTFPIGGVILDAPSGGLKTWRLRYRIDASTESTPEELTRYISLAGTTADNLEKEFSSDKEETTQPSAPPVPAKELEELANTKLKAGLDAAALKVTPGPAGKGYAITSNYDSGRRQTVSVGAAESQPGGMLTHPISTTVWTGVAPPNAELLRKVLGKLMKLGTFSLTQNDKKAWELRFGITLDVTPLQLAPTDTLAKSLKDTVTLVGAVGEQTDKELNGDKDIN